MDIFCDEDGEREFKKNFICPACNTELPGKHDVTRVDLNPLEEYKSMVLAGLQPEVILQICSRAIAFWTYQVHHEIMYQEYTISKIKERAVKLELYYENVLKKTRSEVGIIKQQLNAAKNEQDSYKKKIAELVEKLLDRSRQYQKLQALYESQRKKFVSPSFFDRQGSCKRLNDKSLTFGISSASDIFASNKAISKTKEKQNPFIEDERNFTFKPSQDKVRSIPFPSHLSDLEIEDEIHSTPFKRNPLIN